MRDPAQRQKNQQRVLDAIARGKGPRWKSRRKFEPSYPESFWMSVFNDAGLIYEKEFLADRYFIDFAFLEKKIAVEIDGGQHLLPERKAKDDRKDAKLTELGWKIYRVPWTTAKDAAKKITEVLQFLGVSQR